MGKFSGLWSILYETFIGKDVRFKDAMRNEKKKLFFVVFFFLSVSSNVLLFKQIRGYREANYEFQMALESRDKDILSKRDEIIRLNEANLSLRNSLEAATVGRSMGIGTNRGTNKSPISPRPTEDAVENRVKPVERTRPRSNVSQSTNRTPRQTSPKPSPPPKANPTPQPNRRDRLIEMLD